MSSKRSLYYLPFLVISITSLGWATPINNSPTLQVTATGTSFIETGTGDVMFKVRNGNTFPLILDYALAIIVQTGGDGDDLVSFGGVTADTEIAANGGIGTYTYGITNKNGNPFEPEDGGKDNVYFWIELSNATGFGPNPTPLINVKGLGTFFFAGPVGPGAPGPDAAVLAALLACSNNAKPTVAACAPGMALYSGSLSPFINQFPAEAVVSVGDVPEPSSLLMVLGILVLLGFFVKCERGRETAFSGGEPDGAHGPGIAPTSRRVGAGWKVRRLGSIGFGLGLALTFAGQAAASNLELCGNKALPGQHSVPAICVIAGGATLNGTATEDVGSAHDFITTTFTLTNSGKAQETGVQMIAQNTYTFIGEGVLRTLYNGTWNGDFSDGSEYIAFSSIATSFNNNPALAPKTTLGAGFYPGGGHDVSGASPVKNGDYSGQGKLQQFISYSLAPGHSFKFPAISEAAVPEPATLPIIALAMILGLVGLRSAARKHRQG